MSNATGPGTAAPYLTLRAPLYKAVYAESADTAWEKYRDQLAALQQSTQREDQRQQMAWGAYQALLMQAHADMRRSQAPGELVKASGEGVRGGMIIGHTKSSKAIYMSGHARYAKMNVHDPGNIGSDAERAGSSFKDYSSKDHEDAASAHFKQAYKADYGKKTPSPEGKQHLRAALAHNRLATTMGKSMPVLVLSKDTGAEEIAAPNQTRTPDTEMTSTDIHPSQLSKAGEGSRGGKIIGHTRSGKPVYSGHSATNPVYQKFHGFDHEDAEDLHASAKKDLQAKVKQKQKDGVKDTAEENEQIATHNRAISSHRNRANNTYHPGNLKSGKVNVSEKSMASDMTSTDILKSFLAKGKIKSGGIEDAETVGGLDADMTGSSANGKSTSGPGGFDDQENEDKKVIKRKYKPGDKNGGPTRSVESQFGVSSADSGKETVLSNAGPYDFGGDITNSIGEAAPTRTVDGNILRSMGGGYLEKAGEGTRGGKIIGHTRSGKPVYGSLHAKDHAYHNFSSGDHNDAANMHDKISKQVSGKDKWGARHAAASAIGHAIERERIGSKSAKKSSTHESDAGSIDSLSKAGEGSRGGKIIGHTRSGKAVYGSEHALYGKVKNQDSIKNGKAVIKSHPNHTVLDHDDAAEMHEKAGNHVVANAHYAAAGRFGTAVYKKSLESSIDLFKAGEGSHRQVPTGYAAANGQVYRQGTQVNGLVVHTTGGLDAYCADLAKGGSFWAYGDRHNPHNPQDQSHLRQVLCKSCNHQHSEIYTACPHCDVDRGFGKSFGQAQQSQPDLRGAPEPGYVNMTAFSNLDG